jgi:hypothetical protein
METKFNFKSQICTSREQSERLLSLGLKKETADMRRPHYNEHSPWVIDKGDYLNEHWLPAWSLHRLIEMGFNSLALLEDADDEDEIFFMAYKNPFESMLEMFEWLIKEGYFPKEYLENGDD